MTIPLIHANDNGTTAWVQVDSYAYKALYLMGWSIDVAVSSFMWPSTVGYVKMIKPRHMMGEMRTVENPDA